MHPNTSTHPHSEVTARRATLCNLDFVVWDLFGIWTLGFGILRALGIRYRLRLCCAAFVCGLPIIASAQPAEPATPATPVKYLLYEFFSNKTMDSRMLRDLVLNTKPVSEIIKENYQLVSVEQGKDPEKEAFYKITHYPTLIIAQQDGTEVDRIIGNRTPESVAATLKAAASGRSKIALAREAAAAPGAKIREHMTLATALRTRNDLAGALKEYQWIFDNGERADPKGYAISFRLVLQQLASLGREYAPAIEELKKQQNIIENAASVESPAPKAVERAFALNEALGRSSSNVSFYLKIPAGSPLKQKLFASVFLALVKSGKYQEAASVVDLEDFVGFMYSRFRLTPGHSAHDGHNHDHAEQILKQRIATNASAACETLVALGETEKARRVAGRALDYLGKDNPSLIARLNSITTQPSLKASPNAKDFRDWLASYAQSSEPKSP